MIAAELPDARRGPGRLRRVDGVVVAWKLGVIVEITPTPTVRHRRDRRIDGVGTSRPGGRQLLVLTITTLLIILVPVLVLVVVVLLLLFLVITIKRVALGNALQPLRVAVDEF